MTRWSSTPLPWSISHWLEKFASALQETEVESELDQKAKNFYQLTLQLLQQTVDCQLMKYSNNTKTN